jgi:glyoxylase-like metal-dependent hydrolase (beta-lactamase superfamily II)
MELGRSPGRGFQQSADQGHKGGRQRLHARRLGREHWRVELKGFTDKPVRFIINTHYHGDHTGGNAYFQKQAPIIAQDNVRKRLESGGAAGNGSSVHMDVKPAAKEALPIITFDHV